MMALSFATDIRPLFRDKPDVEMMQRMGLDLASYDDVRDKATAIHSVLAQGTMPCDGPWPPERVSLFKQWMDEGMAP